MILTLTRDNTATKGLIVAQTDETTLAALRCYKPAELEELSLTDLQDGAVDISIVIGQKRYDIVTNGISGLIINGVDQIGQTAVQISDTLSLLFLESTGGGAGTTDNTTPPHLPFKSISGTFEDSTLKHTIEPLGDDFQLEGGKEEVSFNIINDNVNGIKKMKFGNTQPVDSPYDYMYFEIDFLNQLFKIISKFIELGDTATSFAILKLSAEGATKLGDTENNNNGTKIYIDDTGGIIYIGDTDDINGGTKIIVNDLNERIELTANLLIEIKSILVDIRATEVKMGDTTGVGNGNVITVDDTNGLTLMGKPGGSKVEIDQSTTRITNVSTAGLYNFANVQTFADNAAAVTGGLNAGDIYKLGGDPAVLCIVT